MQFCDLKMSKMAVADCSGVGDVVMPKHTQHFSWLVLHPSLSKETKTPARHSVGKSIAPTGLIAADELPELELLLSAAISLLRHGNLRTTSV
jgi:hypothetical protein